jgi:hypothetical protein
MVVEANDIPSTGGLVKGLQQASRVYVTHGDYLLGRYVRESGSEPIVKAWTIVGSRPLNVLDATVRYRPLNWRWT